MTRSWVVRFVILVAAFVGGYALRFGQEGPMRDHQLSIAYSNYSRLGWDDSGAPADWWKTTRWRKQIESDLARPVCADESGSVDQSNEDFWGTAYLIANGGSQPLLYRPGMDEATQDTRIRYLCFLIHKKCNPLGNVVSSSYGNNRGYGFELQDLSTYPVSSLDRNVRLVVPTLRAVRSDDSAYARSLVFATISQEWSQELCFQFFEESAREERIRRCTGMWRDLYSAAKGRVYGSESSPAHRAGAMQVLERIRSVPWSKTLTAVSPSHVGLAIEECVAPFPWPPVPGSQPTTTPRD